MITKIFPYTLIILDLAAAAIYFYNKDIRHGVYWFAAATLTACVTI